MSRWITLPPHPSPTVRSAGWKSWKFGETIVGRVRELGPNRSVPSDRDSVVLALGDPLSGSGEIPSQVYTEIRVKVSRSSRIDAVRNSPRR